jgi:hypothetical protein
MIDHCIRLISICLQISIEDTSIGRVSHGNSNSLGKVRQNFSNCVVKGKNYLEYGVNWRLTEYKTGWDPIFSTAREIVLAYS